MSYPVISLSAAALLTLYLCASLWRRQRVAAARRRAWKQQWADEPLDASRLLANLQSQRGDFVTAARARSRLAPSRRGLVAAARQVLAAFSYFQHVHPPGWDGEHETHRHSG